MELERMELRRIELRLIVAVLGFLHIATDEDVGKGKSKDDESRTLAL
jgi:hypothetical protein